MKVQPVTNYYNHNNFKNNQNSSPTFGANKSAFCHGLLEEIKQCARRESKKGKGSKFISLLEDDLQSTADKIEKFWF